MGLYNTNNASESFFKNLLHTHIKSTTKSIRITVLIILEEVIDYFEILYDRKPRKNPSVVANKRLVALSKKIYKHPATNIEEGKGVEEFLISIKNKLFFVNTDSCTCWQFLWYGKKCIHMHLLDWHLCQIQKKTKKRGPKKRKRFETKGFREIVDRRNSARKDRILASSEEQIHTDSDEQILSDSEQQILSDSDEQILSDSDEQILSDSEEQILTDSEEIPSEDSLDVALDENSSAMQTASPVAILPSLKEKSEYRIFQNIQDGKLLPKRARRPNKKFA